MPRRSSVPVSARATCPSDVPGGSSTPVSARTTLSSSGAASEEVAALSPLSADRVSLSSEMRGSAWPPSVISRAGSRARASFVART
ncbi:MAG: hypothetical protein OXD29_03040, partial [Roseovarius sp.]|nr:hypothetical protein [Roseovarius sp.]